MIFVKKDKDGKELTWFHLSYVAPKPETQPAKLFFFFFAKWCKTVFWKGGNK